MTAFLALPWYTQITLFALILAFLGLVWGLIGLCLGAWRSAFWSVWTLLSTWSEYYLDCRLVSHGSSRFAYPRDVARAGGFREEGLPLGQLHGQIIHEPSNGHAMIVAPPRAGKSRGVVCPAIVRYPGSIVVADLRSELYEYTHAAREAMSTVYRWAPGRDDSCSLNPLDNCPDYGAVQRLVHHLLLGNQSVTAPVNPFAEAAVPLLTGIILHCQSVGQGNFPDVRRWMLSPDTSVQEKLDQLRTSPREEVQEAGRQALDQSPNFRSSMWNAALAPLTIFGDARVANSSRSSDITWARLCTSTEPVSVFLQAPFGDVARVSILFGVLIDQLCAEVSRADAPMRHGLGLILDECGNLGGRLPELERGLTFLQGSGCQVLMAWQSIGQIVQLYGPESAMLTTVGSSIFYRTLPTDRTTSRFVSEALGQTTVGSPNVRVGQDVSQGTQATARPLLLPEEVARLGETDALILLPGCYPVLGQKLGTAPVVMPWFQHALQRSPWVASTAAACLLLAFCLWPLRQLGSVTPLAVSQPVQASLAPLPSLAQTTPPVPSTYHWPVVVEEATPAPVTKPITTESAPMPTTPVPTAPPPVAPPPPSWILRGQEIGFAGKPVIGWVADFPTQAECEKGLKDRYDRTLDGLQEQITRGQVRGKITRKLGNYTWETTPPWGKSPEVRRAWCSTEAVP